MPCTHVRLTARAMAEKSEEVVSSNSFSTQMLRVVNSFFFSFLKKETNGPHVTALSSRKCLYEEQFEGNHIS